MQTPDLSRYLILHRGMRADADRLAAAVSAVVEQERTDRGHALARWYTGYHHELHAHHTIEDSVFFPAILERVAVFDSQVDRIEADHQRLEGLLVRSEITLANLSDAEVDWPEAAAAATETANELSALMRVHLDFEDTEVLPLFVRHFGLEEYEDLEERARKGIRLGTLRFTVPWFMEAATPDEQGTMLADAPFAFRLLWHVTRRRYRRMAHDAFGSARPAGAVPLHRQPA